MGAIRIHPQGETRRVTFKLDARDDGARQRDRVVAAGSYRISVGGGQPGTGSPADEFAINMSKDSRVALQGASVPLVLILARAWSFLVLVAARAPDVARLPPLHERDTRAYIEIGHVICGPSRPALLSILFSMSGHGQQLNQKEPPSASGGVSTGAPMLSKT